MTKAIAAICIGIVLLFVYAAVVASSDAEELEQRYWQSKAREEGREHGKAEET